ncbi:TPA: DUF1294 domain-containing protein [Vibrio vulnificus]|uniref:DUF1294 domain-containing protein n=1 Tax=Vibrio vulnificus TaxID=672 RepID=UPI0005F136F6|nr:DUF1294 domain-containing protein [Vibrio vulnificus]HAS6360803.1 DUF1294 domain-containing protein [Vibrio vulnificus]HDY7541210.1 DUF1294 domain-containing protein [Vibrio vulnificus]HDY7682554.1 DUF1294 domain-containing protein [Vibrio vulnificus]
MAYKGRIAQWSQDKGNGFIKIDGSGEMVYFNKAEVIGSATLDDVVTFEVERNKHGQVVAVAVQKAFVFSFAIGVAIIFLTAVFAGIWLFRYPALAVLHYFFISAVTFVICAFDVSAAKESKPRVPEVLFYILALIGGWPGAFFAHVVLSHKVGNTPFLVMSWLMALINMAGFAWTLTDYGKSYLYLMLDRLPLHLIPGFA